MEIERNAVRIENSNLKKNKHRKGYIFSIDEKIISLWKKIYKVRKFSRNV